MDLYDEADKHIARFSEVIKELADANQLMDEDQLIDFIDDWGDADPIRMHRFGGRADHH